MKQDASAMYDFEEEQGIALQSTPAESPTPASAFKGAACESLSSQVLAAQCAREIDNYRRGEPWTEEYGLELLRRAIVQGDQEAWAWMQNCFGGLVRGWLLRHPKREVACCLESDENYVVQAFARFCPQEFNDVQEIYRLRRSIMERLLRNADQLRWRLK